MYCWDRFTIGISSAVLGWCSVDPWKLGGRVEFLATVVCKDDPLFSRKPFVTVENLKYGAVELDHIVCSKVGRDVSLLYDGNAVDAAVATALCLLAWRILPLPA
jgi:hypothetical protein